MTTRSAPDALVVRLEDLPDRSWWRSALTTLAVPAGTVLSRFVGVITRGTDTGTIIPGPTFVRVRRIPDRRLIEADSAPDADQALTALLRELEERGWVSVGKAADPWAYRFEKAAPVDG